MSSLLQIVHRIVPNVWVSEIWPIVLAKIFHCLFFHSVNGRCRINQQQINQKSIANKNNGNSSAGTESNQNDGLHGTSLASTRLGISKSSNNSVDLQQLSPKIKQSQSGSGDLKSPSSQVMRTAINHAEDIQSFTYRSSNCTECVSFWKLAHWTLSVFAHCFRQPFSFSFSRMIWIRSSHDELLIGWILGCNWKIELEVYFFLQDRPPTSKK